MAGFMSGFGTTLAQLIEEDRKYYRDAAAKRRDYIQTYGTRAVTEREDKANAALGVANTLMNRGFSKEYVTSIAANNGVRSMVEFADQISKRTDLTEKDIKEIEASAKDFVNDNPDEDLSTVVKRAYGLYKSTKDPVARKRNIFGAMLGLDASMMEDDVLNDMYIDGYTGSDIYRIMGSAGPGAGKPMGVKLPPKPFTFKQNNDFINVKMVPSLESSIAQERAYILQESANNQSSETAKTLGAMKLKLDAIDELIKNNKYSEAMQTYLESDNLLYRSSFAASLQQFDEFYAGSVSRNPLLTDSFKTTYLTQIGDIKDDEAAAAGTTETAGTQAPVVTTEVKQPPKNATVTDTGVIKFETVADRDAAVEAGTIPLNARVKVGDGPIVTFTPPPSYEPVDTSMTDTSSLEGVADASGVSVAELIEPKPELTVEERVQAKRDAAQGVIDAVDSNVSSFTQRLDQGFASGAMTTNAYGNTILGGVAQTVGANDLADFFYTQAVKSEDGAETTEGLIPAINNLLDEFGVPDYSETDDPQVALDKAVEFVLSAIPQNSEIPKRSSWTPTSQPADENGRLLRTDDILFDTLVYDRQNEPYPDSSYIDDGYTQEQLDRVKKEVDAAFKGSDLDAALDRAPEHIEKLGSQATDAWRKLTAAVKDFSLSDVSLTTADEDNPTLKIIESLGVVSETEEDVEEYANVFTRASDTPAYKRLQEIISDRTNVPKRKAKKVVEQVQELEIDNAMAGYVQKMDLMGATPSREDIENLKTILELEQLIDTETQELYRGPISGKTLVEKLDDLVNPAIDFVRGKNAEAFRKAEARRGRGILERDSVNVEDSPSLSFLAAENEPDAQTRTRAPLGDTRTDPDATLPTSMVVEQMTTRGKRATPSGLMSPPSSGAAPKLGQAEFGDLIDRVHGSSKAAEAFNNKVSSGKVTAADVTRLIKATRKLPKTSSRGRLLESLFDLRDALNKR